MSDFAPNCRRFVVYGDLWTISIRQVLYKQWDHNQSALSCVKHSSSNIKWFKEFAVGSVCWIRQSRCDFTVPTSFLRQPWHQSIVSVATHDISRFPMVAGKVTLVMKWSSSKPISNKNPKKRLFLSLSEQRKERFSFVIEIEVQKGLVPSNIKSVNEWAFKHLLEWSSSCSDIEWEAIPAGNLSCTNPAVVCKCLCYLVKETRKTDGTQYPPSTNRCLQLQS